MEQSNTEFKKEESVDNTGGIRAWVTEKLMWMVEVLIDMIGKQFWFMVNCHHHNS